MALRATGQRYAVLHRAALQLSDRLAALSDKTAAKLGRVSNRELRSPGTKIRG